MSLQDPALLQLDQVSYQYAGKTAGKTKSPGDHFNAVESVSLEISAGQIFGLAGESGSGKSTLGKLIAGLEQPDQGRILLDGRDLASLSGNEAIDVRRRIQIVFQNPGASLSPRRTVYQLLREPLDHFRIGRISERETLVAEALEGVGLDLSVASRRPGSFSIGQRQRIAIARALIVKPELLIADEPVSALDVSVQAQVLDLLLESRKHTNVSMLFISHDLAVIRQLADRVGVMFQGRVVEEGDTAPLFSRPLHPYTRQLLASVPSLDPDQPLPGGSGGVGEKRPQSGCAYRERCIDAFTPCRHQPPLLAPDPEFPDHRVLCHIHERHEND